MPSLLAHLFEHLAWADREVLAALERAPSPPAEALRLLSHLLAAERVWLGRIRGESEGLPAVWPEPASLAQAAARLEENRAGYRALMATLEAPDLDRPVAYRSSRGEPFTTRLEDILAQVVLHGAHHRGQIALLVREAGGAPAGTDYITFVRQAGR
jgi:uncharacterized damage-inducible protein DinB